MEIACNKKTNMFVDILLDRRSTSDFMWASRSWKPVSAYIQPHKSNATQIKSIVLHSYRLRQVINEISEEENVPPEVLYKKVEEILKEMGYNRHVHVLRWLGLFTSKILKKLCSSILVNEQKILQVKSQMGRNPVLFVPSHRSYGDFILMSYICFHYDLDIPRIAAGMDFHSMVIMGRVLRDSCAFFMRRSFNNDKLYTAIFSQYVQTLVTDGDAAVEFFIEGTRSRTSKALMPKFGFLSMALKPFLTGLVPDISVIPVNLSYDRALEEILFAYELLGVPKPKESTKGFLKALSILKENYGNVYVQFGDPFSVKEYFGSKIDRSLHNFGPVQLQDLTLTESKQIISLAHTIINRQRDLTVITCFNLIAAIINNNLVLGNGPLLFEQLEMEVTWLLTVMKNFNVVIAIEDNLGSSIKKAINLHKNLVSVSKTKEIHLCRIFSTEASIDRTKLKGYDLSVFTMDVAIPLTMIQNYVNPCSYFLISLCIIVLICECFLEDNVIDKEELFRHFQFLRSIFAYEFVFHSDFAHQDFEKVLTDSRNLKVISSAGPNSFKLGDNEKLRNFCLNFFSSFIPGYVVAAEVLLEKSEDVVSESETLKCCQKIIQQKLSTIHPANLSLDLLSNALQSYASLGLITKLKGSGEIRYKINRKVLQDVHLKLLLFDIYNRSTFDLTRQFSTFIKGKL